MRPASTSSSAVPRSARGNGSVMYCAPLGVAYAPATPSSCSRSAPALSRHHPLGRTLPTACLAVTLAVAALVRGEPGDRAVIDAVTAVAGRRAPRSSSTWSNEAGSARPIDGPDMGFTFFTAGLALQVAAEGLGFEEGLRYVVGLGGDTDTNAAVAGALLGALHGRAAIPPAWLDRLADREAIERRGQALAELVDARSPGRSGE